MDSFENKKKKNGAEPKGKTRLRMYGGGLMFAERTYLFQKVGTEEYYVYSSSDPRIKTYRGHYQNPNDGRDFYVDTALLERVKSEALMIVYEDKNAYDLRPFEIPASEFENVMIYESKQHPVISGVIIAIILGILLAVIFRSKFQQFAIISNWLG